MAKKTGMKLIANNKKAFHDYFIEDTYEAGIALAGTEKNMPVDSWSRTGRSFWRSCWSMALIVRKQSRKQSH